MVYVYYYCTVNVVDDDDDDDDGYDTTKGCFTCKQHTYNSLQLVNMTQSKAASHTNNTPTACCSC